MTDPAPGRPRGAPNVPDPFAVLGALVTGLQHATPEVTEHLAKAGYELMLAGKALLDNVNEALADMEGHERSPRIEQIPVRRPT